MTTATTPQAEMPTAFRFLDLPPELRNRVYDLASSSETLVNLFNRSSDDLFGHSKKIDLELFDDALRCEENSRNRLALLLVSKEVHREAWSIFFANMILNFPPHVRIPEVISEISALADTWKHKLQYIQHLEMQDGTSDLFLWIPAHQAHEEQFWWSKSSTSTRNHAFKALFKLRAYMYNVRSVTIKPSCLASWAQMEFVARVLYNLADSETRCRLERMFPRLEDIVVVNKFGAERYVKSKAGRWMRAYSKEEIPLRLSLPLWQTDLNAGSSHMVDKQTGLTAAHAVTELDPQSAVEQASED